MPQSMGSESGPATDFGTELKALVTIFLRQFEEAGEEQKNQD